MLQVQSTGLAVYNIRVIITDIIMPGSIIYEHKFWHTTKEILRSLC